jgi:hypothetical protein
MHTHTRKFFIANSNAGGSNVDIALDHALFLTATSQLAHDTYFRSTSHHYDKKFAELWDDYYTRPETIPLEHHLNISF